MGVLNWLKSIDDRFVDDSADRAIGARARQAQQLGDQRAGVVADVIGGKMSAEQMAPELLDHLARQARGRQAPQPVMDARVNLASVLGPGAPTGGTDVDRDALAAMLAERGMMTGEYASQRVPLDLDQQRQQYELANAIAELKATASPAMASQLSGLVAKTNETFKANPWARGVAYTGIGGGAAAGAMGLTEAGRQLLMLSGVLDSGTDEEGSPMQ
jgi:hypothetical protein